MKKTEAQNAELIIEKVKVGTASLWIKGQTPMIYNCMSSKAFHDLLLPPGRKTEADKAQTLKHDPLEEYRNSVYRRKDDDGPTRLIFPVGAIKCALKNAALEIPGAKKAQIGRLVWITGESVDVYGIPAMFITMARNAGMNRTPDPRTRALVKDWACRITVRFVMPTLNETTLARLIEMAGLVIGLGDFRQEKGSGNYGQFSLCDEADVKDIIQSGGRVAQDAALEKPGFHDIETERLYEWFVEEKKRRGK